jgi:hypothetical protein
MMNVFLSLMILLAQAPVLALAQKTVQQLPQEAKEKVAENPLSEKAPEKQANDEKAKPATSKITQPLPFKIGETLFYDVSFEKLIFSGTIGDMKFSVTKPESLQADLLTLNVELISKGFFPMLFGIKVHNQFRAVVSAKDFGLINSMTHRQEGKVNTEEKNRVLRDEGLVTYIHRDLANQEAPPKVLETTCPYWVQDIISAIYFIRTQELKEGQVIAIPVTDYGQNYTIEAVIGAHEEVKVDAGKFNAIKVETKAFGGKLIKKSGELFLWFSDDARRLPVKARLKVSGATVDIELKKIQ